MIVTYKLNLRKKYLYIKEVESGFLMNGNLNYDLFNCIECQSSCIYHVFYMITNFYLVCLHLWSFLTDIGRRLQQLQDLIISATALTVSEILLLRNVSEKQLFLYGHFLCIAQSEDTGFLSWLWTSYGQWHQRASLAHVNI